MGEAKRRKKTFEVFTMPEIHDAIRNFYRIRHTEMSFMDFIGQREFKWDGIGVVQRSKVTTKVEHHIAKKIRMLNSEHHETLFKAWQAKRGKTWQ